MFLDLLQLGQLSPLSFLVFFFPCAFFEYNIVMTVFLVHYAKASHGMIADFLDVSSFGRERLGYK